MKVKKSFYPSDTAIKYMEKHEITALSEFLNSIIELMDKENIDVLSLRDKIKYANKYQERTDALEDMLYKNPNAFFGASQSTYQASVQADIPASASVITEKFNDEPEKKEIPKEAVSIKEEVVKSQINDEEEAERLLMKIEDYLEILALAKRRRMTVVQYEAQRLEITVDDYEQVLSKASRMGYDVATYITLFGSLDKVAADPETGEVEDW